MGRHFAYEDNLFIVNGKFFFLKLLILFSSCQSWQDESLSPPTLFRPLAPDESGIDFANHIRESQRFNFLTYPYSYNGGGVAVGDLDNDGLADVYFTGNMEGDRLYHNRGDLRFEDITRGAGILKQNLWTTGVTMADVNNDGLLDIYVCRSGDRGFRNNLLYINRGNMQFEELAREWGVNDNGYSTQATFLDYDLDGDLDMYLVNHATKFNFNQEEIFKNKYNPEPEEADQLYRNEGDHFINVSREAGIRHFAFGLSATVSDLNLDGYPDIYAGSDFFEPDFLYINQQDGTFQDVLQQSTQHISFSSMGADIADFNNDGLPDILVADMQAADHERFHTNMVGMNRHKFARMLHEDYHYQYMQNTLQMHRGIDDRGVPIFSELGQIAGVSSTDWSWATLFFDMDNDGWKDLFIANGIARDIQHRDAWTEINAKRQQLSFQQMLELFPEAPLQNFTFVNNRNLDFRDVSETYGIDHRGASNGAAYADLDNDGDLDLLLNNLNDTASLYENTIAQQPGKHYLQVQLRGREDNHFGLGAKVSIHFNGHQQYQELTLSRGFQSSVPPMLHFGLDTLSQLDRLEVIWPNGQKQVLEQPEVDRRITLDQQDAAPLAENFSARADEPLLLKTLPTNITHQEDVFDDFSREPLLPFKQSSHGPVIAVGDANGDGIQDFYFGGSKGYPGTLYLQSPNGRLQERILSTWRQDSNYEDTDALFLDADNDGDLDLMVASGSTEYEEGSALLQDRLYLNDGQGNFAAFELPELYQNTACLAAHDFDQDGDVDVFVGGASVPGAYPRAETSWLLINEGGQFQWQKLDLEAIVQDAVWTDLDGDDDQDLIVAGHWMEPQFVENQNGKLLPPQPLMISNTEEGLAGLWNSILPVDQDKDGHIDLVLGNEGQNTRFQASPDSPLEITAADFDQNGSLDAIFTYHQDEQTLPVHGRDKILGRLPTWQRKFPDYQSFANMNLRQMLDSERIDSLLVVKADQMASCILYNNGQGGFSLKKLPPIAQISAVRAIISADLNGDTYPDLILAGNRYDWEVETSRNDAGIGLVLLSDKGQAFKPLSMAESGFLANGEVQSLAILKTSTNSQLLVGQNRDSLLIYRLPRQLQKLARKK